MKKIIVGLFLTFALGAAPLAPARAFSLAGDALNAVMPVIAKSAQGVADDAGSWPVKPSEAALIAQKSRPGSTVLGVKLLSGGQYAVTLKIGGSVQRVMVNATSGAVS